MRNQRWSRCRWFASACGAALLLAGCRGGASLPPVWETGRTFSVVPPAGFRLSGEQSDGWIALPGGEASMVIGVSPERTPLGVALAAGAGHRGAVCGVPVATAAAPDGGLAEAASWGQDLALSARAGGYSLRADLLMERGRLPADALGKLCRLAASVRVAGGAAPFAWLAAAGSWLQGPAPPARTVAYGDATLSLPAGFATVSDLYSGPFDPVPWPANRCVFSGYMMVGPDWRSAAPVLAEWSAVGWPGAQGVRAIRGNAADDRAHATASAQRSPWHLQTAMGPLLGEVFSTDPDTTVWEFEGDSFAMTVRIAKSSGTVDQEPMDGRLRELVTAAAALCRDHGGC